VFDASTSPLEVVARAEVAVKFVALDGMYLIVG
jgi:hypothetical protein